MPEPAASERASNQNRPSRRRKRLLILSLIVFSLGLLAIFVYFLLFWQDMQLRAAIAEADMLDQGWRTLELEARRTVVRDEKNSALVVASAKKLLPAKWPNWDSPYAPENNDRDPEATLALKTGLWTVEAPVQLSERQITALREELARAAAALAEARKLADLRRGRFLFQYSAIRRAASLLSHIHPQHVFDAQLIYNLLAYDALLRAQEEDMDGALASCRARLNGLRALGDEPLPYTISQRILLGWDILRGIERTLAQGQPSESALAAMQQLLEDEASQPLFLIAARAERALQDRALEALQNSETSINELWGLLGIGMTPFASGWEEMMMRTESVKVARAALLRFHNEVVEIAKWPPEEQRQALRELAVTQKQLPRLVRDAPMEILGLATTYHLELALTRAAIVMVAVERYRRAHGRWPEALTELVPVFIEKVPLGPYAGAPLRLGRFPEGVVVYSVGIDGQDNGGNVGKPPLQLGNDLGWRLWDVQHRRQLPRSSPGFNQPMEK